MALDTARVWRAVDTRNTRQLIVGWSGSQPGTLHTAV